MLLVSCKLPARSVGCARFAGRRRLSAPRKGWKWRHDARVGLRPHMSVLDPWADMEQHPDSVSGSTRYEDFMGTLRESDGTQLEEGWGEPHRHVAGSHMCTSCVEVAALVMLVSCCWRGLLRLARLVGTGSNVSSEHGPGLDECAAERRHKRWHSQEERRCPTLCRSQRPLASRPVPAKRSRTPCSRE